MLTDFEIGVIIAFLVVFGLALAAFLKVVIDSSNNSNNQTAGSSGSSISGWIDYNNGQGVQVIEANQWVTLRNNAQGFVTNKEYRPPGVTELMRTPEGWFDFRELNLGDAVLIRNDFDITPTLDNTTVNVRYSLGANEGSYVLGRALPRLDTGIREYQFALGVDYIYIGDDNTRNNFALFQIFSDQPITVRNNGSVVQVIRNT